MKRRIGIFLDVKPESGGAFQFCQTVLRSISALPLEQYEVVAVYTSPLWRAIVESFNIPGLYVNTGLWGLLACRRLSGMLPMSSWRSTCLYFHPIAKRLHRLSCDLWIFPAQDTWTYLLPVPALGVIFDLMHRYERRFPEVSARGIYGSRERHYRHMAKWANGIIVDSEVGKRHVTESYEVAAEHIHVLPFVPPDHVFPDTLPSALAEKLPRKYLFYPAQFWRHKNHLRLIAAAESVIQRCPGLNLVFVGSPKNGFTAAVESVNRLGLEQRVHFLGYVPDEQMGTLYRRARAMIMPTFFGPTNIPPLEAMALGCPVAVSRIYGMPEQLGDAAIYFDPFSVEEIADVIERVWTNDQLCADLARKGRARSSQWTHAHFGHRLEEIIRMCCGRKDHGIGGPGGGSR
jgi:glycosyltransferase involved in cell wall biosynthesis